jgi:3-ketosteroid 9alpha-monooxygenase subunit A
MILPHPEKATMVNRYDKPIPFGWYALEYSDNLKTGDVTPLQYFGRDLVLFRTESGEARLLDAFCPHLGAHMGHGGVVKGENIACPFHGWQFDGDGVCQAVPYATNMPPKVKDKQTVGTYPVVERNAMVWAWYHPHNEPILNCTTGKLIPLSRSPEKTALMSPISCSFTPVRKCPRVKL